MPVFRLSFHGQGKIYELYARSVTQSDIYGFIEVSDIIFGERSEILVDPTEERLKGEFAGVKTTYIPVYSIIRIDEVEKPGTNKVMPDKGSEGTKVTPFPLSAFSPSQEPDKR